MSTVESPVPTVLCFSRLDPTGSGGLQADIETIGALGAHPLPIATALSVQDTRNVEELIPVSPRQVAAQARALLADIPVAAIKIGLLGSVGTVETIRDLLAECEGIPVVLDPVLRAGGGAAFSADETTSAMVRQLVPRITVLSSDKQEALRLAPGAGTVAEAAGRLTSSGCRHVLVTGAEQTATSIVNHFHGPGDALERFEWPRIDGAFHGSGGTLAAAVAARLACGADPRAAVAEGQRFTRDAVSTGYRIGTGERVPNRRRARRER